MPASLRVSSWYAAKHTAVNIGRIAAGVNTSPPGRMMISTPTRPATIAAQTLRRTRSRSSHTDRPASTSGDRNVIAEASASGMYVSAEKKNIDDTTSTTPRITCSPGRRLRTRSYFIRGPSTSSMNSVCVA